MTTLPRPVRRVLYALSGIGWGAIVAGQVLQMMGVT